LRDPRIEEEKNTWNMNDFSASPNLTELLARSTTALEEWEEVEVAETVFQTE